MKTLIDEVNAKGERVVVEVDETLNGRGRVEMAVVRISVDETAIYEGPDSPEAEALWKKHLTARPKKKTRKKAGQK